MDEKQPRLGEHFFGARVSCGDLELFADNFQPRRIAIADRNNVGALDIAPGVQMIDREKAAPDQSPSKRAHDQPSLAV